MRKTSPRRLEAIAEAALVIFTERGYRLTQVSDVAAAAGVSAGSIYNYAAGKEALLRLALLHALGRVELTPLPMASTSLDLLIAEIGDVLVTVASRWPVLSPAAVDPALPFRETMAAVVDELFAFLARYRRFVWLLDRLALEMEEVRRIYVDGAKTRLITTLTAFLALHRSAPAAEVAALARGIHEAVAWFAMHRHRDRLFPALDEATALAIVRAFILDGVS